jgi:YfiH family protein
MIQETRNGVTFLRFQQLAGQDGLRHAVTTREQNYAPHRGLGCEQAIAWRHRVCEILEVPFDRLTSPAQVHGSFILRIEQQDYGRGRDGRESAIPFVDGLITDSPAVPIILLSADCPLICVFDPHRPAIGAAHASWLGTVGWITIHLVERMSAEFGSDPARLLAAIAPSAEPCCYEVGEEVRRIARARLEGADDFFIEKKGRLMFDMWSANRRQLLAAGVREENIEIAGLCSICDQRFWSHRRQGEQAGRTALFITLA